ncbi:TPA: hypothetical protein N0F65_006936 [Lagenidium giganteum]|uniref:Phosphodiesterase n=1 Tax=Lagenidium giganteum TaxID=4803 RepID=A0AAV2ZK67_9STRA|nr:TPA: hypothetical protein N0F65_006936 [Lagenidium giganteum]
MASETEQKVASSSHPSFAERIKMPSFAKRQVQVLPKRPTIATHGTIKQRSMHKVFGCFLDSKVECDFQTYYRREKQASVCIHMVCLTILCVVVAICGATQKATQSMEVFAASVATSPEQTATPATDTKTVDMDLFVFVSTMSFATALAFTAYVWQKRDQATFISSSSYPCDPLQLVLLLFCQANFLPVVWILIYCTQDEYSSTSSTDQTKAVFILVAQLFVDSLYFFLLLVASVAACLLRVQFAYFVLLAVESLIIVSVFSGLFFTATPERWGNYGVLFGTLMLLCRGVWESEHSCRRQFLSSTNLVNENRRLSNQNIEMKEELSGKLSYQMHYEMGDILRILCQIKLKMTPAEKRDIDKIITALITNEDLFEVTLDPAMAEHEEEVQGWLHMMAFKEPPPSFSHSPTSRFSERSLMKKPGTSHQLLRTANSRKMSRNIETEAKVANEVINKLFVKDIIEEREEFSKWLFDTIRNEFFVDVFYIDQRCASPMQAVFISCVELNDFVARLSLDINKLVAFAGAVENHYFKRNPYHNCLHASAVIIDINFYLRRLNLNVDDITFFVGLIAAAGHDISHPGVSNGFLIATRSKLAITYSDDSVLERMHVAELYRILSHEKFDIFSHLPPPEKADVRKLLIQMVLATDLSRHFPHISKLKSKKFAVSEESRGLEVSLIMETLLMLADLGHCAKPFHYHQLWANRIAEEFFRQGDAEERNNLPVSPLCDRKQANLPKSQVTFLTLLATPLFETAGEAFAIEDYAVVVKELQSNIRVWQGMIGRTESNLDSSQLKVQSRSGGSTQSTALVQPVDDLAVEDT